MKAIFPILLLIALTAFDVTAQLAPSSFHPANPVALLNVSIVDVERGGVLRDQSVIVSDGRITAVGPSRRIVIPPEAVIVNGKGKYLTPGFADMHVHLYTEGDLFTYLANGITTVRNMAGDASHLDLRKRVSSGEILGPRIITAGPVVETAVSHPDNILLTDAKSARREVARQKAAGYDFVKVYNNMAPDIYAAVTSAAAEQGIPVVGHVPFEVGLNGALDTRQRSVEHLRGYANELVPRSAPVQPDASFRSLSLAWQYVDASRMRELALRTVAAGTWNCVTFAFTVHEMSPDAEHRRILARPETKLLSLKGLPERPAKSGYLSQFTDADFIATQTGLKGQFSMLRALDKEGAGLLVGTDSWLSGYAFVDELELLVKAGLKPARVLKMATVDAARFLNESEKAGTIGVGKRADLVLLDANPLTNIANARRVHSVVFNGNLLTRKDLDDRLATLKPSSK